ncbi:MAG: cobalamin-dependent protein [Nanoarchaeota archaeon]
MTALSLDIADGTEIKEFTAPRAQLAKPEKKIKVGMTQVNNSFNRQSYIPLTLGYLYSHASEHAKNFEDFEFLSPIFKRIPLEECVEQLREADVAAFSTYVWNFEISKRIAERLKQENPDIITIAGGYQIHEEDVEGFLRKNRMFDIAIAGEGERAFTAFLESYPDRAWHRVPSAGFIDENGRFIETERAKRIEDLNEISSPFLNGYFNRLMDSNNEDEWIGLFETNRGCPFPCNFCAWGGRSGAKKRMTEFSLEERLFQEIEWFGKNKIGYIFCCDSNFGMYSSEKFGRRDLKIAQQFAHVRDRYGYPKRFSVQNTKNSTEDSYEVQKVLYESGLDQGILLAIQSLNPKTLEAVDRKNIGTKTYLYHQRRATEEGKKTFSDLILGLPEETYESFVEGVNTLIELGQHNRIQFNNLSILPNTVMYDPEYRNKYGLVTVETDIVNIHGSLGELEDGVYEKQQLVVATNSMPKTDWVRTRNFGYMAGLLHFNKVLQIPNVVLNSAYSLKYSDVVAAFVSDDSADRPIIGELSNLFSEQARSLQRGGPEYTYSRQWLNMWWPTDEFGLIKLATEDKLDSFYGEAKSLFSEILEERGYNSKHDRQVVAEAVRLNRELMKMPYNNSDLEIHTDFNTLEVYKAGLLTDKIPLVCEEKKYKVDRTRERWNSWEDWCREVVWWCNKKGAYMYDYAPIEK